MKLSVTGLLLAAASFAACTSQPDATTHAPTAQAPAATRPPAASGRRSTRYAGEYRWGKPGAEEPGGVLTVYPESDSTILFHVDASDGAPGYHLATVLGRARLRGNTAYYFNQAPDDEHGCQLKITFGPTVAQVVTVPGFQEDCYFGANMTPDETYRRTSRAIPQQVVDTAGDTLRFAHLPPDLLQHNR